MNNTLGQSIRKDVIDNDTGIVIYADKEDIKGELLGSLNRLVKYVYEKDKACFQNLTIVFLSNSDELLDQILGELEKNPNKKVVLLEYGFSYYDNNKKFQLLKSYPKVGMMKLPFLIGNLHSLVKELHNKGSVDSEKLNDELFGLRMDFKLRILGILQHDLKPNVIEEKGVRYKEIIAKARETFDIKPETPDENVEQFILTAKRDIKKVMEGEISGVYCDIDDTIFDKDEKLKEDTLKLIQRLESEGHTITIWTGGDMELAKTRLVHTPYAKYKVVSKYDYAGATAEIVIDNVSPEKFFIQSGISAKKFLRV